ncbi:hypothetical protein EDC22_1072 [Tepidamorphus gemmatus]|uniref:Uncharacterized protein n=2 Tax=Tepidamorphus gemmatus TaxID=747076 RepID=A0A4R3M7W8_9HYPH|nr:hypothetical protein EDC22_1072 [Tepidamorphus gemmatus]
MRFRRGNPDGRTADPRSRWGHRWIQPDPGAAPRAGRDDADRACREVRSRDPPMVCTMRLTFRCLPGYESILPKPVAARTALPDWLRAMPATTVSETLGGLEVRTLKHCPPLIDALSAGVLMPLAADLTVAGGELSWDWEAPRVPGLRHTRSPIGLHVPEQVRGVPLPAADGQFVVKFTNFWALEAPEGWSILFVHPLNREDLPFRTLAGLVDCDRFSDGFVHFPALWTDPGFEGVLPAGTPVAQAIPVRREAVEIVAETMDVGHMAAYRDIEEGLSADPGLYRRTFRVGPG